MSTPKSISSYQRPRQPASPLQTISFSNRESSPRAASLARLTQSPIHTPPYRSGTGTPTVPVQQPQLLQSDFRKIDPVGGSYGSLGSKRTTSALSRHEWTPQQDEDPEIIRKHLVSTFDRTQTPPRISNLDAESSKAVGGEQTPLSEEFSSLQLQGGDTTRQVYRFAEQSSRRGSIGLQRSHSFSYPTRRDEGEETVQDIMVPGGFRRNFIQRAYSQPISGEELRPNFVTRNFLHFLTLYGHFAGEDLEEWDEPVTSDEEERVPEGEQTETLPLLKHRERAKSFHSGMGNATMTKAALLLLKSFVGTGVLFLPKAFKNGGMLFSSIVLPMFAMFSLYCFMLLVNTRKLVVGSYGDIGGALFGKKMRLIILASIVISQVGFVCAYTIFTAQNLSAFVSAVSRGQHSMDARILILLQLVILLPCAMIRDISKLSGTALIADFFIMLGLCILYYFDIFTLATKGVADITLFNRNDFVLSLGTAAFAFEGIGLIIPIQESMIRPQKFKFVLTGVMIILILLFTSIGALSYAAYGSAVKTVIISSLPQDSAFVNAVQFLYSLAILLSTPLQLFPAIRILENGTGLALRSGKQNPYIKWKKNIFRSAFVILTAGISAAGANSLERFVALTGNLTWFVPPRSSNSSVPLMFIYPPLLHYRACAHLWWQKVIDVCICVFGIVATVYNTMETTRGWLF